LPAFLSRERIVAPPDFNRWLVPPAALAIHLSIGMAYGFSVFWLPLSRVIGITTSAPDDWKISTLGWMYTLFFVMLGSSAAVFGPWLEREGPRKAGWWRPAAGAAASSSRRSESRCTRCGCCGWGRA
jgi:hypothetical protein